MSREFIESGQSIPVTIIKVEKGRVIEIIDKEKRGYSAIKLGYFKIKNSKLTNQMKNYFSKKILNPRKFLKNIGLRMLLHLRKEMNLGWSYLIKKNLLM